MTSCVGGGGVREEESRPMLIEDSEQLNIESRSRRKRFCMILSTVGLGVGLCLAIALPLTLGTSSGGGGSAQAAAPLKGTNFAAAASPFLQMMVVPDLAAEKPGELAPDTTASTANPHEEHTHHDHAPHRRHTLIPRLRSTTPSTHENGTTTTPLPRGSCPYPHPSRRGMIDLDRLDDRVLFEVARIQTYDSPGSVYDISCAAERFNLTREKNHTETTDGPDYGDYTKGDGGAIAGGGSVKATWEEGGHRHRVRMAATVQLTAAETANDWTMTVIEPEHLAGIMGHLSVLAQLDGYLLTYACYPMGQRDYEPGYVIAVHVNAWAGLAGVNYQLVDALLGLANVWRLNPDEFRPIYLRQRHCNYLGVNH